MSRYYDDVHPDHIDPETNRPYAGYSSDSLDTSFHDHEMDVEDTPEEKLSGLADALLDWKCPSCGGAKVYMHRSVNGCARVPCKVCNETGLHPIAYRALDEAGALPEELPWSPLEEAKHRLACAMLNQVGVEWEEVCNSVDLMCEQRPKMSAEELIGYLDGESYSYEDM